ncbi:MAG: LysR family transcriptional regulator [Caulobacteraceae bacterium]
MAGPQPDSNRPAACAWSQAIACDSLSPELAQGGRRLLSATFRQLQIFVLTAESGRFSGAAASLGISPAAVSDHIRKLEKRIGYPLFDRRPGGVPELSEKGKALFEMAPALLAQAAEVANLSNAIPPSVLKAKVGAGEYILEEQLYPNLPQFQVQHPNIQIEFIRLPPTSEGARAVQDGRCDLAYLTLRPDVDPPHGKVIGSVSTGLFVSPRHPLARTWGSSEAPRLPLIMPLSGSGPERFRIIALAQVGLADFEVVTRAEHSRTQLALTVAGVGACCLFYEIAQGALDAGDLIDLGVKFPDLPRWALRRPRAFDVEHLRLVDSFIVTMLLENMGERRPVGRGDAPVNLPNLQD